MSTKFYSGQKDYIAKLNEMDDAFSAGPYNALPLTGGTLTGPITAPLFIGNGSGLTGLTEAQITAAVGHKVASLPDVSAAAFGEVQRKYLGMKSSLRPNPTFVKALLSGKVTVVIAGDSISEGADEEYVNGWVSNFTEMLVKQIPWVEWEIINLSLGGRGLRDLQDPEFKSPTSFVRQAKVGGWDSQVWPDGSPISGKAWRDYVKDANPDMIVMAHQENMGEDVSYMELCWNSLKAYADSWTKVPWWCFVSTHLPTNDPTILDGAFSNVQVGRQGIADWIRATAMHEGYGFIDNNSVMRMLRDGKRPEVNPYTIEKNFRFFGDSTQWNSAGGLPCTLSGSVLTLPAGGRANRLGRTSRDFDCYADYDLTANSFLNIRYRQFKDAKAYLVQYSRDSGNIQIYCGSDVIASQTPTSVTNPCNIRVRVVGSRHQVYYNGKKVVEVFNGTGSAAGTCSFGLVVGYGSGGTISNLHLGIAETDQVAPPYVNNVDLFGVYPTDINTNPDTLFGDGVHHLSTKGVFLVYLTAVQDFIDGLVSLTNKQYMLSTGVLATTSSSTNDTSFTQISDTSIKIVSASEKTVMAHINLNYKNEGNGPGVLEIRTEAGAPVFSCYLPPTSGGYAHPLSVASPVPAKKGTTIYTLWWGAIQAGQPPMTTGAAGGRSLTISTSSS